MFQRQLWWEVVVMEGVPDDYTEEEYCQVSCVAATAVIHLRALTCALRQVFRELCSDSLDLFKQGIGARAAPVDGQRALQECAEIFTLEFYASIMGMFELNNIGQFDDSHLLPWCAHDWLA